MHEALSKALVGGEQGMEGEHEILEKIEIP